MNDKEKIAMVRGYIFAKAWEQTPMFIDQMGCVGFYEDSKKEILSSILSATEKTQSFLDVYTAIKDRENKELFDDGECDYFNKDLRDGVFSDIDDILSESVTFNFFHTSPSGMIDAGNYEELNGRGKEYNENLNKGKK